MSSNFDKLLDLTKGFEPSSGAQCDSLGNNVFSPISAGLNDFNKGVGFMTKFGDYSIPINEAVEYVYDTKLLHDHIQPVEQYFKAKLKEMNTNEIARNKNYKGEKDLGSSIGFMQGMDGEPTQDEQEAIKLMAYNEHESKFPPPLSTDIPIKSSQEFIKLLSEIYKDLDSDTLNKILQSASGFINAFDINSFRNYIETIKEEIQNRNFSNIEREKREF